MSLRYTDAVILDIQRLGSVIPLSISHTNYDTITIDGFIVPPRTLLTVNTYAMHHNPKYWTHPDELHPEHFLDNDGAVTIPKGFAPFSVGTLNPATEGAEQNIDHSEVNID